MTFHLAALPISWTTIIVWTVSGLLAIGIGWSRFEKKRTRDTFLAELAAFDRGHRENPAAITAAVVRTKRPRGQAQRAAHRAIVAALGDQLPAAPMPAVSRRCAASRNVFGLLGSGAGTLCSQPERLHSWLVNRAG